MVLRFVAELVAPRSSVLLVDLASSSEKTAKGWLKIAEMPARGKLQQRPRSLVAIPPAQRANPGSVLGACQYNQLAACNTLGVLW